MMRTARRISVSPNRRIPKDEKLVALQDKRRLIEILEFGFIDNNGHSNRETSWDRYYVNLREGVTVDELLDFCIKHLKGSPIPENTLSNGPALLTMFEAAKYNAKLVDLEFVFGDFFLPELGRIG